MNFWLDRYRFYKDEVICRINELVRERKDNSFDLKSYPNVIYIQDSYTGEYSSYTPVCMHEGYLVANNNYEDLDKAEAHKDLDDLDLNELISICDFMESKKDEATKENPKSD